MAPTTHDVVIVGGGHNGLTAAAYLARAGKSVLVLERDGHLGGAAVSATAFKGVDARLSRYSYLVSLLPKRIIEELGLELELARRRYSSYTPDPARPGAGLLVDHGDAAASRASFDRLGAGEDFDAMAGFHADTARLARALFPTVCEPLPTRSEARVLLGDDALWNQLIEQPIGRAITARFGNDTVRGLIATDALIGTFTSLEDPSLAANRCFLYHVIGNGTGDWDLPIGGMGAVTAELERAAREAGAQLLTRAEVTRVTHDGEVSYRRFGTEAVVRGRHVLANVAPAVLRGLLGEAMTGVQGPEGAQVKVNLMLRRLPRLRDESVSAEAAFGGTFHINEGYGHLEDSYRAASDGEMPGPLPCEIYCHSLTDPSILSDELAATGAQTLTVFGLHTPHRWLNESNNEAMRQELQDAALASLNSVLAEPVEELLLRDAAGVPCVETKTTLDLEHALNMPGGNIFHGSLEWPFLEDGAARATPAQRWGVDTGHERILICGAGARRGGGVSGLGGHNAAMAVLDELGTV
ncbi:phytoene dehydrogenase-like protein [Arthrobacter silviterrae]|uniref:NAD(P)/FAD-dependent oxidoreductase n=1 Tax=Arthrobacter silviterrae TaxID=2026658 RepID=A0ABX0DCI1_9MICC|nr:NAD(P)/FAD-dependent oxidoreductase [Arthrobacter silviterrae]MDQ0276029.1 phytoene dehydrogenase-like protein [Arthrobacter silviterrae]NGN84338.1 NAD(P)/FAD-dependent oxidoreductase [Arthrobacter silviterrae]